jgi:acyl-[acyl-carrier-protein]-phospholipid O-acyltransferase/long-chain-fatty-acid--[acyl-carrier-protein] ligase
LTQLDSAGDALPSPPPLSPGFRTLLGVRLLTVVNDNLARWLVIGVGKRAAAAVGTAPAAVLTIGTVAYVLPFLLLAWLAGWLADRNPKRTVVAWGKFAEIGIAAVTVAAIGVGATSGPAFGGLPAGLCLLLLTTSLFGGQTSLMNPSLIGTIPETVPKASLSRANGLFALLSLAATLIGMAVGNWLADATPLDGARFRGADLGGGDLGDGPLASLAPAAAGLLGVAVVGWLLALKLPRIPAADPTAPPPGNAIARTFTDIRRLVTTPKLAGAAAGIIYFWGLAAVAQLNVDQYGFESGATTQGEIVPLLVALVGGIGLGSVIAGRFSRRGIDPGSKVDLGFVPLGAIVMGIAHTALALSASDVFGAGDGAVGEATVRAGLTWRLAGPVFWLAVLGTGAGLFDVPLEAYLQEQSPPERRGAVLAATNMLVFTGMLVASMAYYALRAPVDAAATPLVSARGVFAIFAALSVAATGVAIYAAPRASLRMFVGAIVHGIWRFRARDEEHLPETGPAVLVANHLSWLDGFLLPLCAPRPVRMVVYGPNIQGRFLRMLADQWRFILFDPRPKSIGRALKTIQEGLAAGDVIGIFCEGGISRHGQILGFKRGLEWLLGRVQSPLVPVHLDGLWGSLLSFSEGRFFAKRPRFWFGRGFRRQITLSFGTPLPAGSSPDEARLALQELSATAVRRRLATMCGAANTRDAGQRPQGRHDPVAAAATAESFDGVCLVRRDDRLLASLAPGDPLHDTLGRDGPRLLGITGRAVEPGLDAAALAAALAGERATIWLARVEQVAAVAAWGGPAARAPDLGGRLTAVVMPIGSIAELAAARAAAEGFLATYGIEPVVAFAPREAGGLVAMNTPPARAGSTHEVTCKPETVGRVVNGVVVWPRAEERERLGMPPLFIAGGPPAAGSSLVVGATLPRPDAAASGEPVAVPPAMALAATFDVDTDGFLVPRPA